MKYAKIINERTIDLNVPKKAVINGSLITGLLPEEYLKSIGFYPLDENPMPEDTSITWEAKYSLIDEIIVQTWTEKEPPSPGPRLFSKLYLEIAIAKLGLIEQFDALLQKIEIEPGYSAYRAFQHANVISESFPNFGVYKEQIRQALGLTEADVEQILDSAIAAQQY